MPNRQTPPEQPHAPRRRRAEAPQGGPEPRSFGEEGRYSSDQARYYGADTRSFDAFGSHRPSDARPEWRRGRYKAGRDSAPDAPFDEADALFGRRTNVQDAHDRYANIEVNYLLQRLESFEGCALLATNLMQGVDDAFLRRFDQVVHFPRPGVAERIAIWRAHLPAAHLADQVSIEQLAERFELTGGEIRNAALSAAFAG